MTTLDVLDKEQIYTFKGLTEKEKITLMEEMYGKGTSTIRYVNGSYRSQTRGVVYFKSTEQWKAQFSVNITIAESLVPFFRGEIKREYKNSQFIVI